MAILKASFRNMTFFFGFNKPLPLSHVDIADVQKRKQWEVRVFHSLRICLCRGSPTLPFLDPRKFQFFCLFHWEGLKNHSALHTPVSLTNTFKGAHLSMQFRCYFFSFTCAFLFVFATFSPCFSSRCFHHVSPMFFHVCTIFGHLFPA